MFELFLIEPKYKQHTEQLRSVMENIVNQVFYNSEEVVALNWRGRVARMKELCIDTPIIVVAELLGDDEPDGWFGYTRLSADITGMPNRRLTWCVDMLQAYIDGMNYANGDIKY